MIEREIELPVDVDDAWEFLAEPGLCEAWLGAVVDWDLAEGKDLAIIDVDGTQMAGVVESVEAPVFIRYRWWPVDDPSEVSVVTIGLRPSRDGSIVHITEQPLFNPRAFCRPSNVHPITSAMSKLRIGRERPTPMPIAA